MLGNPFIYWTLRWILLLTLLVSGWCISYRSKNKKQYWQFSAPSIVLYSIIEGLRWRRGVDYLHYYQDLTGLVFRDYPEKIYSGWITIFKECELPYWVAFVLYSFLLITSVLYLLQKFPKAVVWVLPLFFIVTVRYSENLIRQYLSLPFIIIGVSKIIDKKFIFAILCFIVALQIHFSALIPIFLILFSFFLSKFRPFSYPIIPIAIFVFFSFLWNNSYFTLFSSSLTQLSLGESTGMEKYVYFADRWLTDEGRLSARHGLNYISQSNIYLVIRFLVLLFIIYFGYKLLAINRKYKIIFWLAYFAIIVDVIKEDIEMYVRIYAWIVFFIPVVIGSIYCNLKINSLVRVFSYILVFLYYVYTGVIAQMFKVDFVGYAFIWDR